MDSRLKRGSVTCRLLVSTVTPFDAVSIHVNVHVQLGEDDGCRSFRRGGLAHQQCCFPSGDVVASKVPPALPPQVNLGSGARSASSMMTTPLYSSFVSLCLAQSHPNHHTDGDPADHVAATSETRVASGETIPRGIRLSKVFKPTSKSRPKDLQIDPPDTIPVCFPPVKGTELRHRSSTEYIPARSTGP